MDESVQDPQSQVFAEIQAGGGLSLPAVGRLVPGIREAKSVDPSTVFRWMKFGAKALGGHRVKLVAVRIGGRWLTSKRAVARFVAALSSVENEAQTLPRTPTARDQASEAAGAKLDQLWS